MLGSFLEPVGELGLSPVCENLPQFATDLGESALKVLELEPVHIRKSTTGLRSASGQDHNTRHAGAGKKSPGQASERTNGGWPRRQGSSRSDSRRSGPWARASTEAIMPVVVSACQGVQHGERGSMRIRFIATADHPA